MKVQNIFKTQEPKQKTFYQLLGNTLLSSITNMTVFFAITFFVYLQTKSVFATAIVAGIYLVITAVCGFWFGTLIDHYKKKLIMQLSGIVSLVLYGAAYALYHMAGDGAFKDPASPALWALVTLLICGVIAGNIRTIALPTIVTILIPEDRRDKANGLVGSATGAAFVIVSAISGLLLGFGGMNAVLLAGLAGTLLTLAHLVTISIPERGVAHAEGVTPKIDIKGTFATIAVVPGLLALILFTTFNNFLGGVFMALMDAYGLSMVSVQVWGILWAVVTTGFIFGGLVIAKKGLGKNPLRTMFLANIVLWVISCLFVMQSWIALLAAGLFAYMCIMPAIEASEQTIIQKVVPPERQGRVFGFAQSVEQAASPLTAFLIGPIAQFVFIPFMTDGKGVQLIGSWFGTGPARGIALVFILTGIVGLLVTIISMSSKYYHQLSERYLQSPDDSTPSPAAQPSAPLANA